MASMAGHGTIHQAFSIMVNKTVEMLGTMWEQVTWERNGFSFSSLFFAALCYYHGPDEEEVTGFSATQAGIA